MSDQIDANSKSTKWEEFLNSSGNRKNELDQLHKKLFEVQEMKDYKNDETPLDAFDDKCHDSAEGIIASKMTMSDSDI